MYKRQEEYGINIIRRNGQIQTLTMPSGNIEFKAVYAMFFTDDDKVLWLGTAGYGLIRISIKNENGNYTATSVKQYIPDRTNLAVTNNIIYSIVGEKSQKMCIRDRLPAVHHSLP